MTNWIYGTAVLPSEQLNESQGTKDVKSAIKAISTAYETYNGYMTKAKDANGNIIDQKSLEAAKKYLGSLKQAITNVKSVLTFYQEGLVIGNKKMGGGLNKDILGKLINSCEAKFDELSKTLQGEQANPANPTNPADPAQAKQQTDNDANKNGTAAAQVLGVDPNTPLSQLTPEQIARIKSTL